MKTRKQRIELSIITVLFMIVSIATAQAQWSSDLQEKSEETIEAMTLKSWEMKSIIEDAYGYAVFPSVGKGGFGIGAAHGKGLLYENGTIVGKAKMTQVSVGFQWGGQAYSEIILFEDAEALELFKSNRLELAAQASAIAVTAGVSADVPYNNGVAIYTMPKGGLMYEATVGGQKFKYKEESESD